MVGRTSIITWPSTATSQGAVVSKPEPDQDFIDRYYEAAKPVYRPKLWLLAAGVVCWALVIVLCLIVIF